MKKYFLLSFILLFLAAPVFSQIPSFEIAPRSEPDLSDGTITKLENSFIVTIKATDVSGIAMVVAVIKNAAGSEIDRQTLNNVGGDIYSGEISTVGILDTSYPLEVWVFAVDKLGYGADEEYWIDIGPVSYLTPTKIDPFTIYPLEIIAGSTVNLSATLTYEDGITPIASEPIKFRDETDNIDIGPGPVTTDDSGVAQINYSIVLGATIGPHTLKAIYAGNATKNLLPSYNDKVTLTVNSAGNCATVSNATVCIATPPPNSNQINSFSVNPTSVVAGKPVTLTATLSGAVGEPISFRDLASPYIIGTAVTDATGTATITYYVSPGTTIGSHTLSAIYNGNHSRGYTPSYKETTLTVTSAGNCATVSNATVCITISTSTNPP